MLKRFMEMTLEDVEGLVRQVMLVTVSVRRLREAYEVRT